MIDRWLRSLTDKTITFGKRQIRFLDMLFLFCTVFFGLWIRKVMEETGISVLLDLAAACVVTGLVAMGQEKESADRLRTKLCMAFATVFFYPPLLLCHFKTAEAGMLAQACPNLYQLIGMERYGAFYKKAGYCYVLFLVISGLFYAYGQWRGDIAMQSRESVLTRKAGDRREERQAAIQTQKTAAWKIGRQIGASKTELCLQAAAVILLAGAFLVPGLKTGVFLPADLVLIALAYRERKYCIPAILLTGCTFAAYTYAYVQETMVPIYVYSMLVLLVLLYLVVDLHKKTYVIRAKQMQGQAIRREQVQTQEQVQQQEQGLKQEQGERPESGKKQKLELGQRGKSEQKKNQKQGKSAEHDKAAIVLYITAASVLGLLIRYIFRGVESMDYTVCLKPWVDTLKEGGFSALAGDFYNYTPPYMYILYGISRLPIEPLYPIKLVSTAFDVLLALLAAKTAKELGAGRGRSALVYGTVFCLPTVFVNSGLWGQCDTIYVTCIIASLYFLYEEKSSLSMLCYGMAFALKLQTLFVFPLYVFLWVKKKYRIEQFLFLPAVYGLMCIPSFLAGKSLRSLLLVYVEQGNTEPWMLSWNWPNIYLLFGPTNFFETYSTAGVIGTLIVLMLLLYAMVKRNISAEKPMILKGMLLFAVVVPYFLPYMHERYGFLADILAVILAFTEPGTWYIAVCQVFLSLTAYTGYLHGASVVPQTVYCFIMTALVIVCTNKVIKAMN